MQCEYITHKGQCTKEAVSNSRFCPDHSAHSKEAMINQYRVACKLLGDAPQRHSQSDALKSLKGEIVLLRSLIESRLNMVQSEPELVAAMPALKDSFLAVEKLVASCHQMDTKLANLLDKQALISLAQDIIQIMDHHMRNIARDDINVDAVIETVGQEIITAIASKENA